MPCITGWSHGKAPEVGESDARYLNKPELMGTLVDSCILIDLLTDDLKWADWSNHQLERLGQRAPLFINPIILAEVSPRFETANDLEAALAGLSVVRETLPWDAAFMAGQAFNIYRKALGRRTSPMPDFYIGAHAQVGRLQLLTRDAVR